MVRELLAGGDAPEESEDEDEDAGGGEDLDTLAFGSSGTRWEVSSGLKDRFKGTCYTVVNAFFETLGDLN